MAPTVKPKPFLLLVLVSALRQGTIGDPGSRVGWKVEYKNPLQSRTSTHSLP